MMILLDSIVSQHVTQILKLKHISSFIKDKIFKKIVIHINYLTCTEMHDLIF